MTRPAVTDPSELRSLVAEFLGTAALLLAVVGSGITASGGGVRITDMLQHSVAIGLTLTALILALAPVSGAHFNPCVTLVAWMNGTISRRLAVGYGVAQALGAVAGVAAANWMFEQPVLTLAAVDRSGIRLAVSELVATAGLIVIVFSLVRARVSHVALAVGGYIAAAIVFTASAAFANPAVTLGRMLTATPTGIAPASLPSFVIAQVVGAFVGAALVRLLLPPSDVLAAAHLATGAGAGDSLANVSLRQRTGKDQP